MCTRKPLESSRVDELRDTLKRCSEGTVEALVDYHSTGSLNSLNIFLEKIIRRHLEPEFEPLLEENRDGLRFIEDLGVDSMTMMEIIMLVEDCLEIHIENKDLMNIRTYGELNGYVADLVQ